MELLIGFEPTTLSLRMRCSTSWAIVALVTLIFYHYLAGLARYGLNACIVAIFKSHFDIFLYFLNIIKTIRNRAFLLNNLFQIYTLLLKAEWFFYQLPLARTPLLAERQDTLFYKSACYLTSFHQYSRNQSLFEEIGVKEVYPGGYYENRANQKT